MTNLSELMKTCTHSEVQEIADNVYKLIQKDKDLYLKKDFSIDEAVKCLLYDIESMNYIYKNNRSVKKELEYHIMWSILLLTRLSK